MKRKTMSRTQVNEIDPKMLVYCQWTGSDDVLVVDGEDLTKMAKETWEDKYFEGKVPKNPTLFDAMVVMLKGVSGNSFDFVLCTPEGPVKLDVKWEEY